MPLVIDLTAEDLKAGSHWLAASDTPDFERVKIPPPQAIIHPWPLEETDDGEDGAAKHPTPDG